MSVVSFVQRILSLRPLTKYKKASQELSLTFESKPTGQRLARKHLWPLTEHVHWKRSPVSSNLTLWREFAGHLETVGKSFSAWQRSSPRRQRVSFKCMGTNRGVFNAFIGKNDWWGKPILTNTLLEGSNGNWCVLTTRLHAQSRGRSLKANKVCKVSWIQDSRF